VRRPFLTENFELVLVPRRLFPSGNQVDGKVLVQGLVFADVRRLKSPAALAGRASALLLDTVDDNLGERNPALANLGEEEAGLGLDHRLRQGDQMQCGAQRVPHQRREAVQLSDQHVQGALGSDRRLFLCGPRGRSLSASKLNRAAQKWGQVEDAQEHARGRSVHHHPVHRLGVQEADQL